MPVSGASTSPTVPNPALSRPNHHHDHAPTPIMLVDRNSITRLGMRVCFKREHGLRVVAEAGCASEAADLYARHLPRIVILDTCLPDRDGLDLAREFLDHHSRVLIFSHCNSEQDIMRAYSARVHGFVAKSSSQDDLLRAVRLLESGRSCFPPELKVKIRERTSQLRLSSREIEVLRLIAKGLANKEIAHQLGVTEATAKTFLARTMKKLAVHDRTQAVLTAIERGWIDRH